MIEPVLQGVGMDSIEDKVREVVDEDVPVSLQNTNLTEKFSALT